jgi:uncharacterized protein
MFADFPLFYLLGPAVTLGLLAQLLVRAGWTTADREDARMSGYAAARHVLDGAGLYDVRIEQVPGLLTDHYDGGDQSLRLSPPVYHGRTLAAVGFAAHEAGHALQQAAGYRPLAWRRLAIPASSFGSGAGILLAALGLVLHVPQLSGLGLVVFTTMVGVQLINLPVEWDASRRARRSLIQLGIVDEHQLPMAQRALRAASLILLAGTLQSILTLSQQVASIFRFR